MSNITGTFIFGFAYMKRLLISKIFCVVYNLYDHLTSHVCYPDGPIFPLLFNVLSLIFHIRLLYTMAKKPYIFLVGHKYRGRETRSFSLKTLLSNPLDP